MAISGVLAAVVLRQKAVSLRGIASLLEEWVCKKKGTRLAVSASRVF